MAASRPISKIDLVLHELKDKYTKTVRNNPETVVQIESAVRICSFLAAGRFNNGDLISELIYAGSNLLVFLNDKVLKSASKYVVVLNITKEKLQSWLTVLEYVEVFLEMGARRKWGTYGAWVVITVIQLTKTVLRLYILTKLDGGMTTTPTVQPVDRSALQTSEEHDTLEDAWNEETAYSEEEKTFTLKSSGRQIRTIHASGHNNIRSWGVPRNGAVNMEASMLMMKRKLLNQTPTYLRKHKLWAEYLHVARPLAHLFSMYIFGQQSWKPWLLSCGMDLTSHKLMGNIHALNARERGEMKRRTLMLLYYLMRSPFYDKYTKSRLIAVFKFIAQYVPLAGLVMRPVLEYLPVWQRMYFYVWAT